MLMVSAVPVMAQNFAGHNWYFGNTTNAIRFNRTTNTASLIGTKAIPFGVGGSSVASDPVNGNLLFYTDGSNIYDVTNAVMPNGTGLGANTSGNQPVAIAKAPGQAKQYYVFMNTANFTTGGSVSFRTVDMSLFGNAVFPTPALGNATTATNTAVAGLTGRSEAMITVPHNNGEDFWLITHANGTPDYSVTLFTATGPGATLNFAGLGLIEQAANFSYHAKTGRIAVSPQETTRDIEILNFNNTNGVLTFNQRVLNTGPTTTTSQSIYDTEWSNNGQYLYVSRFGEPGVQADVFQYDLLNSFSTLTSVLPQPNTIFRSFGLQMAPDSAIYHLYQTGSATGPFLLGTLTNTDTVASEVIYDPSAFTSNPDFKGMQFPTFAPKDTVLLSITFTSQGTCSNAPTSFFPTVKPAADSLVWDFGDGNGATEWSPVYTYTSGGTFNVKVKAFLDGDTASFTQPVTITQFDLKLTLVQDTTACACELPINNGKPTANGGSCPNDTSDDMTIKVQAQNGSPTYQWFGPGGILPTQTSATLKPDSAGYYYVVATVGSCSAYAGVNLKEYDSLDQRANIWYFGKNAGIDFNPLPKDPAVAITGPLNTPEGCSVISDRNGQVIFSTDGQNIFDKNNANITPLPNPPGLGGEPGSTQSALIIPVPGDETLYYIFTTKEVHGTYTYELRYSLFDLKLNNGNGGLAESNKLLFSKSTERITGNGNWLIAHEYGNNSFRAYKITQQGISNPVISSIGSDHSITVAENGQGYMELGAQNRLAVALSTPGVSNVVEVFDFVDSTGTVTNFRSADLKSPTGQVYGIEISPTGNKLFATLTGASSKMYEFAFDTLGIPHLKQTVNQSGALGAMQIGPDGQIYVAINGSTSLGTFQANEDTTQISAITTLQPFALAAGTQSQLGLPNFTQILSNPTQSPGVSFTGVCLGDSTKFTASGKDSAIDKFDWFFGDGQGKADGGPQIAHLYAAAGTYTVTVHIYNKCEVVGDFVQTVVIHNPPPDPTKGVNLCTGAATLDANPGNLPNFTYAWSTGESTKTVSVNKQAIYKVTITDAQGCTTDGSFLTSDNRPQVQFGPDLTLCQNTPVFPLNAQNPGATYAWTVNGAAGGTAQTQSVSTATPGVFDYKVKVTDPVTTCFAKDSITYTIKESPAFTATPTNPSACGANDGKIALNITAPVGSLFTYFITGPSATISNTDQPIGTVTTPATLAAGTYGITVSDQVSGCATINTANVNDPAFTVAGTQHGTCDPITIDATVTPTSALPVALPLSYRVINNGTAAVVQAATSSPTTAFTTTTALQSNNQNYIVEVTAGGCKASSPPINIKQSQKVQTTLTANPCVNPVTISAGLVGAGVTYAWTGPNITAGTSDKSTMTANPPQGNQTYNLHITQTGVSCALDTAITVNVNNTITADFAQTTACANQVTLSATPTGPYTYRWFRNNVAIPGGGGQSIVVGLPDNGQSYRVDVVNAISGCTFSSPPKVVNVAGDLQITLASTTPCEGSPFTLTAGSNQATVTYAWTFNGSPISGQVTPSFQDTRAGLYEVSVSKAGCTVKKQFNIVLGPVTPGLLTDTGIICADPSNTDPATNQKILDPGPNFISYNWFKEQLALGVTTQTYTVTEAGNYSVDMINSFGCSSSDKTTIREECDPRIVGPNAFRPTSTVQAGGEFANQNFRLFTFFIDDTGFQVFIFNRWGEMVYQSTDRNFRWNGGYNNNLGQPLPAGTYSYVVKYKSSYRPEEGVKEKRGGVVLLR
jgi:gliding motility-associated-like protein